MLRDHAGRAIQLQYKADGHIRCDGRRIERIESVAGSARKQLAMAAESRWPRRDRVQNLFGYGQLRRLQRSGQGIERFMLIRPCLPFHRCAPIASHGIDVIDPGHHRRGRFDGVAVIHKDWHQRLLDGRHGGAFADGVFT